MAFVGFVLLQSANHESGWARIRVGRPAREGGSGAQVNGSVGSARALGVKLEEALPGMVAVGKEKVGAAQACGSSGDRGRATLRCHGGTPPAGPTKRR